jgi:hypothetical protein
LTAIAAVFSSCKKPEECECKLKYDAQHPADKFRIEGFDCNCRWVDIPMPIDTTKLQKVIDVMGILDLRDKLGTIGSFAADTNYQTTADIMMRFAITSADQFQYITSLDSIKEKNPIPRFQVRWNGNCVAPAVPGIVLTFAQYEKWSHLRPGLVICTGLNGEKFQVSEHEIHLFPSEMQGLFEVVYDQTYLEANLNQPADIPAALAKINSVKANTNQHLTVSNTGNFDLNNTNDLTGVRGLDSLLNELNRNYLRINYVNGGGQIGPATDSVAMQTAQTLQKAQEKGWLKTTTIAGHKYWFILQSGTIHMVPVNQVVRVDEADAASMSGNNVIANQYNMNGGLNASLLTDLINSGWNKTITLNVMNGGYISGATDQFMDNFSEPGAYDQNAQIQANANTQVAEGYNMLDMNNGLKITHIDFNGGNQSGHIMDISHKIANGGSPTYSTTDVVPLRASNNEIVMNIFGIPQNYNGENGKPYIDYMNTINKALITVDARPTRRLSVSDKNIVFSLSMMYNGFNNGNGGTTYGVNTPNCEYFKQNDMDPGQDVWALPTSGYGIVPRSRVVRTKAINQRFVRQNAIRNYNVRKK